MAMFWKRAAIGWALLASAAACGGEEEAESDEPLTPAEAIGRDWQTHSREDYAGFALAQRLYEVAEARSGTMEPAYPPQHGTLASGGIADFPLVLNGAKCYEIVAVGDGALGDLDLLLFDPQNVLWQQDATDDAEPLLGEAEPVCPLAPGVFRLRVRSGGGGGDYAFRVFSAPAI